MTIDPDTAAWLRRENKTFIHGLAQINDQFHREAREWPEREAKLARVQKLVPADLTPSTIKTAKFVSQGEYGVSTPENPYIGTMGVGPCLGLILVGQDRRTTVAHIDAISDAVGFVEPRAAATRKAYLLGGGTETNLAFNVLKILEDHSVETIVSTQNGPSSFIYDANNDRLHLEPSRSNFGADWAKIDQKMGMPFMQRDLLRKNPLKKT